MCKSARENTRQHTQALSGVMSEVTGHWLKQSPIVVTYGVCVGGGEGGVCARPSQQPEHHNSPEVPCPSQTLTRNLVPGRLLLGASVAPFVPKTLCPSRFPCSTHPSQPSHMFLQPHRQ